LNATLLISAYAKTNSAIVDDFPSSGGSVCGNTTVVFQAVTSFDLGKVQFSWTGPMGQKTTYTQLQSPYRISGNTNVNLFGMNYPYGNFTLTASAIDKASSAKTINFKVIKC
jgi:hypothetical protein